MADYISAETPPTRTDEEAERYFAEWLDEIRKAEEALQFQKNEYRLCRQMFVNEKARRAKA